VIVARKRKWGRSSSLRRFAIGLGGPMGTNRGSAAPTKKLRHWFERLVGLNYESYHQL